MRALPPFHGMDCSRVWTGTILPVAVRRDRLAAYRTLARKAGKLWREHGALQYVECVADDVPE